MLESLEQFSNIALFSAMAVYAIAFVFYVIDFAGSSATAPAASALAQADQVLAKNQVRTPVAVGAGAGASVDGAAGVDNGAGLEAGDNRGLSLGANADTVTAAGAATATATLTSTDAAAATASARAGTSPAATATRVRGSGKPTTATPTTGRGGFARGRRSAPLRIGFALTVLGFLFHLTAVALRGIGAGRVPYANMYEFAITGTLAIVLIFLLVQFFVDLRFLGALVTGLALLFLGITRTNFYVAIVPLPAALDSYWLVIHITVAVLSVGFFTISFGLSVLQLLQHRRERQLSEGARVDVPFVEKLPNSVRIEDLAYRVAIIGFICWSFTLVAGSIWAERAWTRYWGWDVKEVWTFVIWVLYAGFIHARATRGWRGMRSAWLSVIAYATVIFNFTIVNVFFNGLHSYSGL